MTGLSNHCKPALARCAKSLKSGADYPVRTDDPLITNPGALLKSFGFSVNRLPHAPQLSATFPNHVNRAARCDSAMSAFGRDRRARVRRTASAGSPEGESPNPYPTEGQDTPLPDLY